MREHQMNLVVPNDLFVEFRFWCIANGVTMSQAIRELMQEYCIGNKVIEVEEHGAKQGSD